MVSVVSVVRYGDLVMCAWAGDLEVQAGDLYQQTGPRLAKCMSTFEKA